MAAFLPSLALPHRRGRRLLPAVAPAAPSLCLAASSSKPPRPPPPPLSDLRQAIRECVPSRILPLLTKCLADSDPPVSPQLWRKALNACLTARNPNAVAAVLFRGLNSPLALRLHISFFVQPLKFLASISKWNLVFPLLQDMWQVGNAVTPDEKLIVSLANTAVNRSSYRVSLKLFHLMHYHQIEMGPFSYSVLLKSHGRANNIVAVKSALAEIHQRELRMDSVLLNSAVDALVRCNDLGTAIRMLSEEANKPLLDVTSYNTIIKGFARLGRVSDAFRVVRAMKSAQCSPNHITRNTLLSTCVEAGEFDRAWGLIDDDSFDLVPTSSPTAPGLGSSSTPQQRNNTKHHASSSMQLTIAITSLMSGLADAGRVDEALQLFTRMKENNIQPSAITYASLISALFRRNESDRARDLFQSFIDDDLVSLEVCNAYMSGLCNSRQEQNVQVAAAVLNDMLSRQLPVFPDIHSFNCLMDGWVGISNFEQAEHILRLMQTNKVRPTTASYTILMKGYSDAGQYGGAKRTFRKLMRRSLRPDRIALNAFIMVCVRSGDIIAAERVIEHMEQRKGATSPNAQSYSPLIASYMRHGNFEEGWQVYVRMRSQGIPLNEYLFKYMTVQLSQSNRKAGPHQVQNCAQLLKDGLTDGINLKLLRKCRKKMLLELKNKRSQEALNKLADEPEFRPASEQIFDRHGWNRIDSGWRVF